jgi:putative membrane protein
MSGYDGGKQFWRDAFALQESISWRVARRTLIFGLFAVLVYELNRRLYMHLEIYLGIAVAPYEVAGAALGLLLVLRTNAGYDRWWEARKLWGGIVNETRNLVIAASAYGPHDSEWRSRVARWTAAFPHACRHSLRGEREIPKIAALLGKGQAAEVAAATHMPGFVALRIAEALRDGCDRLAMDRFAFLQADQARFQLVDHVGGCERILKTPLPRVYDINIRRFLLLFLVMLPFALLDRVEALEPLITVVVAFPLLSLDEIGAELQNPFDRRNVGHLPLDEICDALEVQLLALSDTRLSWAGAALEAGENRPWPEGNDQ